MNATLLTSFVTGLAAGGAVVALLGRWYVRRLLQVSDDATLALLETRDGCLVQQFVPAADAAALLAQFEEVRGRLNTAEGRLAQVELRAAEIAADSAHRAQRRAADLQKIEQMAALAPGGSVAAVLHG